MFHRSLFRIVFVFALAMGAAAINAQTAPVSGSVELQKADGTREPLANALVEVYRADIKASSPPAKTNKKGEFSFAGLQLGFPFILSISAPGASPNYVTGIKAGQDKVLITLYPGDGSKYTEDQVRGNAAKVKPSATGGPVATTDPKAAADQKKAQADFEAKRKEVEEKNKKASQTNEVVAATLKAGNEAYVAKNYDLAITKYEEGIAADPAYVGSAPIFNNNRATALMSRAVETYNKSIKNPDPTEKVAGLTATRKDIADSAAGFLNSWTILKNASAADIADKGNYEATKLNALRGAKDTFQIAVRTEQVEPSVIEAAKIMIPEYISVETDAAKKAQANLIFADLYRVSSDSENAIAAYKKILESSPDDLDALAGAGLSLVNYGYIVMEDGKSKNDKALTDSGKAKLQEGANYLQKYSGLAPEGHKYKADAVGLIETLKKEQNVTPQKVTTTRKKP